MYVKSLIVTGSNNGVLFILLQTKIYTKGIIKEKHVEILN